MASLKTRKRSKPEGLSWAAFKEEWRDWLVSKEPVFRFGLKFVLLMALFYGLFLVPGFDRLWSSFLAANARVANAILNAMGQPSHVSGEIISSPRFNMAIRRGCEAIEPTWLFCAAVLSYPAAMRRKLIGIALSAVLLQLLNLVRIVSLFFVGVYAPTFFNTAHLEIWPIVFILAVLLLMLSWIQWARQEGK
jgi:exosortase H (IPTLxxWG-CTERM-specific)